jgi:hypothetical protein
MKLSQQALKEFKEIWKQDHPGQALTDDQVLRLATKLMTAVRVVCIKIPENKLAGFTFKRQNVLVVDNTPKNQ